MYVKHTALAATWPIWGYKSITVLPTCGVLVKCTAYASVRQGLGRTQLSDTGHLAPWKHLLPFHLMTSGGSVTSSHPVDARGAIVFDSVCNQC